jgi:hypothetical protein
MGWTGFALGFGGGLGLADVFVLVVGPVTDAAAFLRSNCSMRARLRAIFASRSSSLFPAYLVDPVQKVKKRTRRSWACLSRYDFNCSPPRQSRLVTRTSRH